MRLRSSSRGYLLLSLLLPAACLAQSERPTDQPQVTAFTGQAIGSGARAMGMGGAFIAVADDASAALWNPAGVAQLEEPEISFSLQVSNRYTASLPGTVFFNDPLKTDSFMYSAFSQDQKGTEFDYASFVFPFKSGGWHIVPEISYRRAINQGLDLSSSPIRYWNTQGDTSEETRRSEDSGGYDVLALTAGFGNGKIFAGTSVNFWLNGFSGTEVYEGTYRWDTGFAHWEDVLEYRADASGVNATLGFLAKPATRLSIGGVFRTPFTLKSDVTEAWRSSEHEEDEGDARDIRLAKDRRGTAEVAWPWSLGVGIAVRPTNHFRLALDYTLANWTAAEEAATVEGDGEWFDRPYPVSLSEDASDADQFRTGFEYLFVSSGVLLPLRAGFFLDRQFFPDAAGNRVVYKGLTLGGGVGYKRIMFDVAAVYEFGKSVASFRAVGKEEFSSLRVLATGVIRM